MDINAAGALLGFLSFAIILMLTVRYQKRFDLVDLASYAGAFLSGNNIPVALYLCWYVFSPDPPTVAMKLHGLEKYVAMAGLCLALISCIGIWKLGKIACEIKP